MFARFCVIYDGEPTLNQHWFSVLCYLEMVCVKHVKTRFYTDRDIFKTLDNAVFRVALPSKHKAFV